MAGDPTRRLTFEITDALVADVASVVRTSFPSLPREAALSEARKILELTKASLEGEAPPPVTVSPLAFKDNPLNLQLPRCGGDCALFDGGCGHEDCAWNVPAPAHPNWNHGNG